MASLTWAKTTRTWAFNARRVHVSMPTVLTGLYKRFTSALLATIATVACALFIVSSFGLHFSLPFFGHDSEGPKTTNALVKPKIVSAATPSSSCTASQVQHDPLFTSCPSFLLDYSNVTKGSIDSKKINVYVGEPVANQEAQYYTDSPQNLRVENGSLILEAHNQSAPNGYKYTSARIDTHGKADLQYGKIVVRAITPNSIGTWPAIWLLPSQPKYADLSPTNSKDRYLNDGEMDVLESVGTQPNVVYAVAHCLAYARDGIDRTFFNTIKVPDNHTIYHNYELDWTPTTLTYSVDSTPYFTYHKPANADWRTWPYDQPYYLVINLALGGTWAGTDKAHFPGDGIDKNALPASLKVQSVYYYSYAGQR